MKHISKIDGREYRISRSQTLEDGEWRNDDITTIWTETADENQYTLFVNFYYGPYEYDITEDYIQLYLQGQKENVYMYNERWYEINEIFGDYMNDKGVGGDVGPEQLAKWNNLVTEMNILITEIEEQNKPQPKTLDLPICYVTLIEDCLNAVKVYDLFKLIYGTLCDEEGEKEAMQRDLQTVLDNFCKPLTDRDEDVTINLIS